MKFKRVAIVALYAIFNLTAINSAIKDVYAAEITIESFGQNPLLPIGVNIVSSGLDNLFRARTQIIKYGSVILPETAGNVEFDDLYPGAEFPSQERLSAAADTFFSKLLEILPDLGYNNFVIHKVLYVDFTPDFADYNITAIISGVENASRVRKYFPAVYGTKIGKLSIAFFDRATDTLDEAFDRFAKNHDTVLRADVIEYPYLTADSANIKPAPKSIVMYHDKLSFSVLDRSIIFGETLNAEDFLKTEDNSGITGITYLKTPDFWHIGLQSVSVSVKFADGTEKTVAAKLNIYQGKNIVTLPVGTDKTSIGGQMFAPGSTAVMVAGADRLDMKRTGRSYYVALNLDENIIYGVVKTEGEEAAFVSDDEPPVFESVPNLYAQVGGSVNYLDGVVASDNNGDPDITVDLSEVNPGKVGRYKVNYTATDIGGNTATASTYISLSNSNPSTVLANADRVLASITNNSMTQYDKARAIYNWVIGHVSYVGGSAHDSVIDGANTAFNRGRGDCFIYYSASEILLTRAGIRNMRVKRLGGSSEHYWNIVNVGDGWYHFDTTPYSGGAPRVRFMFSESQAQAYSRQYTYLYYGYDHSLYPTVNWN